MWGSFAHITRVRGYRCERCDVYGTGEQCWSCGTKRKLDRHAFVPNAPAGSHRHDLRAVSVAMAGDVVQIEDFEGVAI